LYGDHETLGIKDRYPQHLPSARKPKHTTKNPLA
jgi:hypothetical protein